MKKEKVPSKRELEIARNVEILKKYYDVDETNKVIKIKFHYSSPSEIINTSVSSKDKPVFLRSFLDEMHDFLETFPVDYELSVDFSFDDYEGYDHEKLLTAFLDMMELERYVTSRLNKRAWLIAIILAVLGSAMIVGLFFLEDLNCLSEDLLGRTIDYIIDTWACIFIWEALSMLLLYPNETLKRGTIVLGRFNSISFSDSNNKVLIEKKKGEFEANWVVRTKKQTKGDVMLFIAGSALIIAGLANILNNLIILINQRSALSKWDAILSFVLIIVFGAIELTAGIAAICRGFEKGKLGKLVPFFGFLTGAVSVGLVALLFTFKARNVQLSASVLAATITSVVLSLVYIIGDFYTRNKKSKKKTN